MMYPHVFFFSLLFPAVTEVCDLSVVESWMEWESTQFQVGLHMPSINIKNIFPGIGIVLIETRHCFKSLRPSDTYLRRQSNHHWFR